jgi:hypothetical protein
MYYQNFLSQFKGVKGLTDNRLSKTKQLLINIEIENYNNPNNYSDQYLTEFSKVDSI